jgi:hypothetical protein
MKGRSLVVEVESSNHDLPGVITMVLGMLGTETALLTTIVLEKPLSQWKLWQPLFAWNHCHGGKELYICSDMDLVIDE